MTIRTDDQSQSRQREKPMSKENKSQCQQRTKANVNREQKPMSTEDENQCQQKTKANVNRG